MSKTLAAELDEMDAEWGQQGNVLDAKEPPPVLDFKEPPPVAGIAEVQCPTCGRIREDWQNPETRRQAIEASKLRRVEDRADRTYEYRQWRRKWGNGLYVSDIDMIEWRIGGSGPFAVAVLEVTRVDGNRPVPASYFEAIQARYFGGSQLAATKAVAAALAVPLFIVAFRHSLSEFWILDLAQPDRWRHVNAGQYRAWIMGLGK